MRLVPLALASGRLECDRTSRVIQIDLRQRHERVESSVRRPRRIT